MNPTLQVEHDGQLLAVDLALVSGLEALVYRRTTGEELDHRLWVMIAGQPDSADGWPLADKAVLAWLFHRQVVDRNADLATVAASITLIPAAAEAAGTDAPEAG